MSLNDWSLGLRISKEKKKRTRKCLFEYKRRQKKIISVQMKSVREKESMRERRKEESIEEKK